jgi:hypothetical protein
MPVSAKSVRGIIIGSISTLFISYHLAIQSNAFSGLTSFDIWLTSGYKPSIYLFEVYLLSFFIGFLCAATQRRFIDKNVNSNLRWFLKPEVWLLAIPAVLLQFIHLVLDHSGRWPLLQNGTNPGEIPDSGLIIYGVEWLFFAIISCWLSSAFGWLFMQNLMSGLPPPRKR